MQTAWEAAKDIHWNEASYNQAVVIGAFSGITSPLLHKFFPEKVANVLNWIIAPTLSTLYYGTASDGVSSTTTLVAAALISLSVARGSTEMSQKPIQVLGAIKNTVEEYGKALKAIRKKRGSKESTTTSIPVMMAVNKQ